MYISGSELVFPCDVRISDVIWKNQQNFHALPSFTANNRGMYLRLDNI